MKKELIDKLTAEQERDLQRTYEEWLIKGRSCEPLDRNRAIMAIGDMYAAIGEKRPAVLFFSSPMMCFMAYGVLRSLASEGSELRPQFELRSQLESQLESQLRSQLESQLESQLWSQLGMQLGMQLGTQLGTQLESQLRSQLWSQLWAQLGAQLWSQLRSQLGMQLWAQLGAQLWSQLGMQLGTQLGTQLSNYFAGTQWCAWEVFYDFCNKIGAEYSPEQRATLNLWIEQSNACHWWFPYKGLTIACERYTELSVNARGQLHNERGMAVKYSDGWGIYALNGVRMPEKYFEKDSKQLDPKDILAETNVEVRRELIRLVGIERLLEHLPHKVCDAKGDYQLLAIDLSDEARGCKYLKMLNPSIGVWHLEGVANECKTVQQALNWRAGDIEKHWEPAQLT